MEKHSKRWLVSRMKTSGSKRNFYNGRFSDERNTKRHASADFAGLPLREFHRKTPKVIQGKINWGLLVRFLNSQVNNDWDKVYSEIIARIPSQLSYCKDMIFGFVAVNTEIKNGFPFNKTSNLFIWTKKSYRKLLMTVTFMLTRQPKNS